MEWPGSCRLCPTTGKRQRAQMVEGVHLPPEWAVHPALGCSYRAVHVLRDEQEGQSGPRMQRCLLQHVHPSCFTHVKDNVLARPCVTPQVSSIVSFLWEFVCRLRWSQHAQAELSLGLGWDLFAQLSFTLCIQEQWARVLYCPTRTARQSRGHWSAQ